MVNAAKRLKSWVGAEEDKSPERAAQSVYIVLSWLNLNLIPWPRVPASAFACSGALCFAVLSLRDFMPRASGSI